MTKNSPSGNSNTRNKGKMKPKTFVESGNNKKEQIAIIGMSGFFPESSSISEFWEKIKAQDDFIRVIPEDHDPHPSLKNKKGAFLDKLKKFDASLFNILKKEATYMPPQQRLLLMSVWNLFEDACIVPSALQSKKVAVIVGKELNPYTEYLNQAPTTAYTNLGLFDTFLPNRISHFFKLNGPSYCIDTACSGGLMALHKAQKILKNKEVDYAIVAGVNLIYGPDWTKSFYEGMEAMGLMSVGQEECFPFQQEGKGLKSSEGIVSILLKRASEAIEDEDNIHGLVIGSAANHAGGFGNIAFPDSGQQSKAIINALEEAQVPAETITHIEAHAASSLLADSEEIKGFIKSEKHLISSKEGADKVPCKISTLKPNLGHMHAASGLVSLVRILFSFKEGIRLGIKNFKQYSEEINLEKSRFYINDSTEDWPRLIDKDKKEIPRRGAINNYGGGGSNVHAIIEEYRTPIENTSPNKKDTTYFLALSGASEKVFVQYATNILQSLHHTDNAIGEMQIEYLYLITRPLLSSRIVFRYKTIKNLADKLKNFVDSNGTKGYYLKGNEGDFQGINEMFLKNKKVEAFFQTLNENTDKSFLFDLWVKGYEEPVKTFFKDRKVKKVSLPVYPFDLQEYCLPLHKEAAFQNTMPNTVETIVGTSKLVKENTIHSDASFVKDHVIQSQKILPAVAYLDIVLNNYFPEKRNTYPVVFEKVMWLSPMVFDDVETKNIQVVYLDTGIGNNNFEVISTSTETSFTYCQGTMRTADTSVQLPSDQKELLDAKFSEKQLTKDEVYNILQNIGFQYGSTHQTIQHIQYSKDRLIALLESKEEIGVNWQSHMLPPYILDGALQALVILDHLTGDDQMKLPFSLDTLHFIKPIEKKVFVVIGKEKGNEQSQLDRMYATLYNEQGEALLELKGFARLPYQKEATNTPKKTNKIPVTTERSIPKVMVSKTNVEDTITRLLAQLLDIEEQEVDRRSKFADLGVDSMTGVEWVRNINSHYKINIAAITTYDYPTIMLFANYIKQHVSQVTVIENTVTSDIYKTETNTHFSNPTTIENSAHAVDFNVTKQSIKTVLIKLLAMLMEIHDDEVDVDAKFSDLGIDSMTGVEWVRSINEYFQSEISPIITYDYPTIALFSEYIEKQFKTEQQLNVRTQFSVKKMVDQVAYPAGNSHAQLEEVTSMPDEKPAATSSAMRENMDISQILLQPEDAYLVNNCTIKPQHLGSSIFQEQYQCKWSYYVGAMYRGISSKELVIKSANANILAIFGYTRLPFNEVEEAILEIKQQVGQNTYGIGFSPSSFTGDNAAVDISFVHLYIKHEVPVIELSAHISISKEIVLARSKGLRINNGNIMKPRKIIGKLSRLELAKTFMMPSPQNILNDLVKEGLLSKEEAALAAQIPVCDDIVFEGSSGGYTDQQPFLSSLPSFLDLRDEMMLQYQYQEPILIGYGGGLGTPSSLASAYMMGADFVITGSINQCTVESGMSGPAKGLLQQADIYDFDTTVHGYALKYGFKIQALTKGTNFVKNSNFLAEIWNRYDSIEEIPSPKLKMIEKILGQPIQHVWEEVMAYKKGHNPAQIQEALQNPKLKMQLIFIWYYAFTQKVTLKGDPGYLNHYQIHSGAAIGAFNKFVKGSRFEDWRHRHVDEIAALLMKYACPIFEKKLNSIGGGTTNTSQNNKKQDHSINTTKTDIAVIGVSGRFPQADTVDEFWNNIKEGKNCIQKVADDKWGAEEEHAKRSERWLGILKDVDKFDPLFFNLAPRTAEWMDPQQRIFMEASWHCFEDAGYTPEEVSGSKCGVFVGTTVGGYGQKNMQHHFNSDSLQGGTTSILSARIAYFLNLLGPNMSIDTACSSSLVAMAEACNSLVLKDSDMALTGGVYVEDGEEWSAMYTDSNMLSKEGRCFTFDHRANGFVPGEGVGCVLLKRLEDAEGDKDTILGVIKGWGVNQDGATNGITAPSMNSQQSLQKDIYTRFGINPDTVELVEAHGTGTALGDPIEVGALTASFGAFTSRKNYCALGSVKSNIGHLVSAAGISGFIKALMAIKNKQIPPTINYEKINPKIDIENSPFFINTELRPWHETPGVDRTAVVSSFGFSGTNGHVVISEYKEDINKTNNTPVDTDLIFVLSAKNEERLQEYAISFLEYLTIHDNADLQNICYSLQLGRQAMKARLGFTFKTREQVIERLKSIVSAGVQNSEHYRYTEKIYGSSEEYSIKGDQNTENHQKIIDAWLSGTDINWKKMYSNSNAKHVSGLPGYPFAKQTYWNISPGSVPSVPTINNEHKEHPLIHKNTSMLQGQSFTSMFNGDEHFFKDHIVDGKYILPGVAYLEMAKVAGEKSTGEQINYLSNVMWLSPVEVISGASKEIHMDIFEENNGIGYEVYSKNTSEQEDDTLYCTGVIGKIDALPPEKIDIQQLKKERTHTSDSNVCYTALEKVKLQYGPTFRGIQEIHYDDASILGNISLKDENEYDLPLGVMDSALQLAIIHNQILGNEQLMIPYEVKEVLLFGDPHKAAYAYLTYKTPRSSSKVNTFNVTILDAQGNTLVQFKEFVVMPFGVSNKVEQNNTYKNEAVSLI